MRKSHLLLFLVIFCFQLFAFEIEGDPKSWDFVDFIGFDKVGDCSAKTGDITSVFTRIENAKLFFRITFDDMIKRSENRMIFDNFADENIQIKLVISNEKKELFNAVFDVNELSEIKQSSSFIRTPQSNLLEFSIDWNHSQRKEDLNFEIYVIISTKGGSFGNQKIVDEFSSSGDRNYRGGNCAFAHHGNQGLTYTEVFYGEYPPETSGFDEVLEVHEATDIPGNFHMSGTLMPAAEWHNPEFNDWLSSGVSNGYVAMLTSALGQHIMSFLQDEMNNWSVDIEQNMIQYLYNYNARVAWVPERVWLSPGQYPDAGVIDWLGDNWTQHGVDAVILDDSPHCSGADNKKIHWMNNGSDITLRVIPIDNEFVGKMHYDADGAKSHISSTGQYGITVYGTDWECAAEMNEHHDTFLLDNYESVLWYCYDNCPAVNVWKLDAALDNPDFNGSEIDVQNGTYELCGGDGGYGGSNNSWYTQWATTASHSDFHTPTWNYGSIWNDAYTNLMSAPDNSLSQLGWYTMMINLHETGWHTDGEVADWEHRYSSHIKNANVYTEASRWANGDYIETTACFFNDIDRDGGAELIIHNDNAFFVFEGIGGKANWIFYKDGYGNAYSVVGSDVAYWSETDGDYNESSCNHFAALSDVSPNQQDALYDISIEESSGDTVSATLSQYGVSKTIQMETGKKYLDVTYNFFGETGYIKSGLTPDLLDIFWSGKSHLQRMWGDGGSYCGQRNSSSGATVALVLGNGGASHNGEFEGTLVKGDEIYGQGIFTIRLYAGYTSEPYDGNYNKVVELDSLASETSDYIGPHLLSASKVGSKIVELVLNEVIDQNTVTDINNYELTGFSGSYTISSAGLSHERKITLIFNETIALGDSGNITVSDVEDLQGNVIDPDYDTAGLVVITSPHVVGTMNGWDPGNHDYDLIINENGVWEIAISLSAGTHYYKIIESNDWDGNDWPASNQSITLSTTTDVYFKANCGLISGAKNYDEFVAHTNPLITGNFIDELGGVDWDTTSSIGEMNDDNDDGIYQWEVVIPEGEWEYKVVLNQNWVQDTHGSGGNYSVSSDGINATVFQYDMSQNITSYSIVIQELDAPMNVIISIDSDSVNIQWDEVPDATSYKVYSSSNPYAEFGTWKVEASGISTNSWTTSVSDTKKFYRVTANR